MIHPAISPPSNINLIDWCSSLTVLRVTKDNLTFLGEQVISEIQLRGLAHLRQAFHLPKNFDYTSAIYQVIHNTVISGIK